MKFTIRDLLLATVIAGLSVGWWIDRQQLVRESERRDAELRATAERLAEAEDLLEFEGVVFGNGITTHTTPERARQLRAEKKIP